MENFKPYVPGEPEEKDKPILDFQGIKKHKNPFRRKVLSYGGWTAKQREKDERLERELFPPNFARLRTQKEVWEKIEKASKNW